MLNDILEGLVTGTTAASPAELTARTLDILPTEEYWDALETALPVYIRQWLSDRRKRKTPTLPEPESFAPDDLLADDVQVIAKKMAKARGSAAVAAIRNEWRRHWTDSVYNGTRYIKFGDATATDLLNAANALRSSAKNEYAGKMGKADYYEKIAAALPENGRVRDLTSDPTLG